MDRQGARREDHRTSRWILTVGAAVATAVTVGGLSPSTAAASPYVHREPLPTVEVVSSPRRVRLLDVRGPVQHGWGWSTMLNNLVQTVSFEVSASVVELTETTWLHFTLGEQAMFSSVWQRGETPPGLFGVDAGVGVSHYTPQGPALLITGTVGPRWSTGGTRGPQRLRPDGFGVQGKGEIFPLYATIPELVDDDRGWFRRYVLSGLNLWGSVRYDQVHGPLRNGIAWSGGLGLDMGRSLILPTLIAIERHRQARHR